MKLIALIQTCKVPTPLQTSILFFQPFDPLEINDGQPLDAKLRIMALLSELEKEMEEKFDRVCIQEPDFLFIFKKYSIEEKTA